MLQRKLLDLLEHLEQQLTYEVERSFLQPGAQVAWDDCSQLYLRVLNIQPVTNQSRCAHALTISFAAGTVRCVAGMDDGGAPPSGYALTDSADTLLQDMLDIHGALVCREDDPTYSLSIERWQPVGPSGNMASGEWVATMRWLGCGCS